MLVFGPVPSRRLGKSLGVNNIPHKRCSYSCVYCQVGRTRRFLAKPEHFYPPEDVISAIENRVKEVRESGDTLDYLSFVPDGEPTLDINLGHVIDAVKHLGVPVAVITNATTLGFREVRDALLLADWVSLKVDTTVEKKWKKINRPVKDLQIGQILANMLRFKTEFGGTLVTESMLVRGINDDMDSILPLSDFLGKLSATRAYISIPIRPPAESTAIPPEESAVAAAYETISSRVSKVECLLGYEGDAFHSSGNPREDILNITAVHPMRESAVARILEKAKSRWNVVEELVTAGELKEVEFNGGRFFVRRFSGHG